MELSKIERYLEAKEKSTDEVLLKKRELVRECSLAIKELHGGEAKSAEKRIAAVRKELLSLYKKHPSLSYHLDHVAQEYFEAAGLLNAVAKGEVLEYDPEFPPEAYLTGLLDLTGELKREMYEALRRKDKKKAEKFFSLMEEVFDSLSHIRFSESVLPEFRRKQDVARIQIEQARGELL